MINLILFDDDQWSAFLPLTFTRPISELRLGLFTIREKWENHLSGKASYITRDYLSKKYPIQIKNENTVINSRLIPTKKMTKLIRHLELNEALLFNDILLAAKMGESQFARLIENKEIEELRGVDISKSTDTVNLIKRITDIFRLNGAEIENDFAWIDHASTGTLAGSNTLLGEGKIYIGPGARIEASTLNTTNGPVYIGQNAEIMEGSHIRGPFVLHDNAVVKMGAKIYGGTTIGPWSKVGGELNNVVIQAYSNKAHDGFLGNAVLGEWCNLGADTNNSNLKNNYAEVKLWDYAQDKFTATGLQFCGLVMGDHSKSAINQMFNTGTVVGVNANIFGSGFPRNFVPSYSWGGNHGFSTYRLDKTFDAAESMMARRQQTLTDEDKIILEHVFHQTAKYRTWEV